MKGVIKKRSIPIVRTFSLFRLLVGTLLLSNLILHLRHSDVLASWRQRGDKATAAYEKKSEFLFGSNTSAYSSRHVADVLGHILWPRDRVQGLLVVDSEVEGEREAQGAARTEISGGQDINAEGRSESIQAKEELGEERDPLLKLLTVEDNQELERIENALQFEIKRVQDKGRWKGNVVPVETVKVDKDDTVGSEVQRVGEKGGGKADVQPSGGGKNKDERASVGKQLQEGGGSLNLEERLLVYPIRWPQRSKAEAETRPEGSEVKGEEVEANTGGLAVQGEGDVSQQQESPAQVKELESKEEEPAIEANVKQEDLQIQAGEPERSTEAPAADVEKPEGKVEDARGSETQDTEPPSKSVVQVFPMGGLQLRRKRPHPTLENAPDFVKDPEKRRQLLQRKVDEQLAPYKKGQFTLADVAKRKAQLEKAVHFIITPQNLTMIEDPADISDDWGYWFRVDQMRNQLHVLWALGKIPEHVEIVVNIEASPRLKCSEEGTELPPLLSYCSTDEHYDLVGVGWQYHRCLSERYNNAELCNLRWMPDMIEQMFPWKGRKDVALWRGSPTGGLYTIEDWRDKARTKLAFLSKDNPDVLDAQFTNCAPGQCTDAARDAIGKELGYAASLSNLTDYVHHKYLVDIDGESWSSRFFQLLASGATVFKQATKFREFSDMFFTPGEHYVQYAEDLSDLVPLLKGAAGRQEELEKMAAQSFSMVRQLVQDEVTLEYMGLLLTSYMELFRKEDQVT